jgi:hypothetical protein
MSETCSKQNAINSTRWDSFLLVLMCWVHFYLNPMHWVKKYSLNALGSFFNDHRAKFGQGSFQFKPNTLRLSFSFIFLPLTDWFCSNSVTSQGILVSGRLNPLFTVVTHPNTDLARSCLTLVIRQEPVFKMRRDCILLQFNKKA